MPNPIRVMPDPVLITIQYLRTISEVTSLVPANRILSALPPQNLTYPYILVSWGAGRGIARGTIDQPSMQIDVVGGSKELCGQIARTVRASIWAIANDVVGAGVLASGEDMTAPQWMPDTTTTPPLSRYVARYSITIHP